MLGKRPAELPQGASSCRGPGGVRLPCEGHSKGERIMQTALEKYLFNCKAFTVERPAWVGAQGLCRWHASVAALCFCGLPSWQRLEEQEPTLPLQAPCWAPRAQLSVWQDCFDLGLGVKPLHTLTWPHTEGLCHPPGLACTSLWPGHGRRSAACPAPAFDR